jgi:hypothetical protein
MTNAEKVLRICAQLLPPKPRSEIARRTDVKPHQQVFQISQNVMARRAIRGSQAGGQWHFWVDEPQVADSLEDVAEPASSPGLTLSAPRAFEATARRTMSEHYGVPLAPRRPSRVRKDL